MKSILRYLALAVALGVNLPASASVIAYSALLNGASESPPNLSPASGTAWVTVDTVLETMRVQAQFSGLTAAATAAHIHCCTAAAFSGVAIPATPVPTFPGFPAVFSGNYDQTFALADSASYNPAFLTANGGTSAGAMTALLAGLAAGKAYFNIHNQIYPGGEIRGFFQPTPVPIPPTVWLMGSALAGLAGFSRKQRA